MSQYEEESSVGSLKASKDNDAWRCLLSVETFMQRNYSCPAIVSPAI